MQVVVSSHYPKVNQLRGQSLHPGLMVEAEGGCDARVLSCVRRWPNGQLISAEIELLQEFRPDILLTHTLESDGSGGIVTVASKEVLKCKQ